MQQPSLMARLPHKPFCCHINRDKKGVMRHCPSGKFCKHQQLGCSLASLSNITSTEQAVTANYLIRAACCLWSACCSWLVIMLSSTSQHDCKWLQKHRAKDNPKRPICIHVLCIFYLVYMLTIHIVIIMRNTLLHQCQTTSLCASPKTLQ